MIEAGIALAFAYTFFASGANCGSHCGRPCRAPLRPMSRSSYCRLSAGVPATPLPTGDIYRTLAGERFNPSELEGRIPVVINLWATWCPGPAAVKCR